MSTPFCKKIKKLFSKKVLTIRGKYGIIIMSGGQGSGRAAEAHESEVSPDKTPRHRVKVAGTEPAGADRKGRPPDSIRPAQLGGHFCAYML